MFRIRLGIFKKQPNFFVDFSAFYVNAKDTKGHTEGTYVENNGELNLQVTANNRKSLSLNARSLKEK